MTAIHRCRAGNFRGTRQMISTANTHKADRPLRKVSTESGVAPWSYDNLANVEFAAKLAATHSTKMTHQNREGEVSFCKVRRLFGHPT